MMTVDEFLKLSEREKAEFTEAYIRQREIRRTRDSIAEERKKLSTRELNNQLSCPHTDKVTHYVANENEFGNLTGGGTYYHNCPDCTFRWSTDYDF